MPAPYISCPNWPDFVHPSLKSSKTWKTDTDWKNKNDCAFNDLPAHASIDKIKTGTCTDYSIALTTLLRKAGYSKEEIYSVGGFDPKTGAHAYNLVKIPGDKKFRIVDTTGNKPNPTSFNAKNNYIYLFGFLPYTPYFDYCKFGEGYGTQNDIGGLGVFNINPKEEVDGCI